jgi:hypothetical protein
MLMSERELILDVLDHLEAARDVERRVRIRRRPIRVDRIAPNSRIAEEFWEEMHAASTDSSARPFSVWRRSPTIFSTLPLLHIDDPCARAQMWQRAEHLVVGARMGDRTNVRVGSWVATGEAGDGETGAGDEGKKRRTCDSSILSRIGFPVSRFLPVPARFPLPLQVAGSDQRLALGSVSGRARCCSSATPGRRADRPRPRRERSEKRRSVATRFGTSEARDWWRAVRHDIEAPWHKRPRRYWHFCGGLWRFRKHTAGRWRSRSDYALPDDAHQRTRRWLGSQEGVRCCFRLAGRRTNADNGYSAGVARECLAIAVEDNGP